MKLTICLPTFNRADYLAVALASICNNLGRGVQQHALELVITDNCSPDSTEAVVRAYQKKIPIIYHKNPTNIGAARNLLKAVSLATGEYVWLFSDDDLLIDGALNYLFNFLAHHGGIEYLFFPRILRDKNLRPTNHGIQPGGLVSDVVLPDGKSLFVSLDGQMPSILGFFSSTIIRRKLWEQSSHQINVPLSTEWSYLMIILQAIVASKCAVLARPGVLCRLQNARFFRVNSKVWFDDYIATFLFAKKLGYSAELCDRTIQQIIRSFSKSVVVDKAKGLRSDSIPSALSRLDCIHLISVPTLPWLFLSLLPPKVLYSGLRLYLLVRVSRR